MKNLDSIKARISKSYKGCQVYFNEDKNTMVIFPSPKRPSGEVHLEYSNEEQAIKAINSWIVRQQETN
jgi:hypothetical protein